MANYRLILEKKNSFQIKKQHIQQEIQSILHLPITLKSYCVGYDIYNCSPQAFQLLQSTILQDPLTDNVIDDIDQSSTIAIELLPGQFDARANAALQGLLLLDDASSNVRITSFEVFSFEQTPSITEKQTIISYFCNPVEKRIKELNTPLTYPNVKKPDAIRVIDSFHSFSIEEMEFFRQTEGLAMSIDDLLFIQSYFSNEEKRNPTETEIKVLDTYWSDHCRHTTFLTKLNTISFATGKIAKRIEASYNAYLQDRKKTHQTEKPITLMDMATLAAKDLKRQGILTNIEESSEINACSIYIPVWVDGIEEQWLLQFKNETHNHPTEIEPFGGASTCLGGCIRDPLSGRAYVYQAMRISGASNPLESIENTLPGKLPQLKICQDAAKGFSSYGNEIGLATTHVEEIYHPGYQAKRMEVGAVVAATPVTHVRREEPKEGDIILLLGGRTGRDGVGGATGSSKEHTEESLQSAGAEVQKGNPPEERKIQRLFRNKQATQLIKKCNDFGAGGVSVAIGELANGLIINLDAILTKYDGLNGTELALSESQERMAVVVSPEDVALFQDFAQEENIESTIVAEVTKENRLIMLWQNKAIVNISRTFLDTNGASQQADVLVKEPTLSSPLLSSITIEDFPDLLSTLSYASRKGLVEQFDSTIGSTTVLLPFGGKYQLTPAQASIHNIPVLNGNTTTASAMSWGFDPEVSSWSPFHGGAYAVVDSVTKLIASGVSLDTIYFSFQEYFQKLGKHPDLWGLPFASLLGAYEAQQAFKRAAIGGKDSMSGTFDDIHVPPTLISFAVGTMDNQHVISNELKSTASYLYLIKHEANEDLTPNYTQLKQHYSLVNNYRNQILSAQAVQKGVLPALFQMCVGNHIGCHIQTTIDLFAKQIGSILIESNEKIENEHFVFLGNTSAKQEIRVNNHCFNLIDLINQWEAPLEEVYPNHAGTSSIKETSIHTIAKHINYSPQKGKPSVLIPVFPGTNCEYDSDHAFKQAGANTHQLVFNTLSMSSIKQSIIAFEKQINQSQILMLSGGFSAGDEPDGSGKFIATILQNQRIKDAIHHLLERDGLILGICNGFQALVRAGLLPNGNFNQEVSLAKNEIDRHVSQIVQTKICSTNSPWLQDFSLNEIHHIAISHGEGRFVINEEQAVKLFTQGQVATQYVTLDGKPTIQRPYNPNGSSFAIEGICSPDGKILGKMGHSERMNTGLYQNYPFTVGQDIFTNGVNYFQ